MRTVKGISRRRALIPARRAPRPRISSNGPIENQREHESGYDDEERNGWRYRGERASSWTTLKPGPAQNANTPRAGKKTRRKAHRYPGLLKAKLSVEPRAKQSSLFALFIFIMNEYSTIMLPLSSEKPPGWRLAGRRPRFILRDQWRGTEPSALV
jgi:hypothetical protein